MKLAKPIKDKDYHLIKKSAEAVNLSKEEAMNLIDKVRTKLPINNPIKNNEWEIIQRNISTINNWINFNFKAPTYIKGAWKSLCRRLFDYKKSQKEKIIKIAEEMKLANIKITGGTEYDENLKRKIAVMPNKANRYYNQALSDLIGKIKEMEGK